MVTASPRKMSKPLSVAWPTSGCSQSTLAGSAMSVARAV